ncbi:phospho-acceptor domain-containing protein [Sphaerotilus hippei]|uniref:histidine kinase n=1 Tax=Sphaerotilus hippei TaxID=744406 RepID=A0A318GWM9_9BURK|nr:ATP-binding protein [Sphaerotilus hippei]PXW93715.1 phospho-acceptor domain-containing protein [Sphaerotilus hippei]
MSSGPVSPSLPRPLPTRQVGEPASTAAGRRATPLFLTIGLAAGLVGLLCGAVVLAPLLRLPDAAWWAISASSLVMSIACAALLVGRRQQGVPGGRSTIEIFQAWAETQPAALPEALEASSDAEATPAPAAAVPQRHDTPPPMALVNALPGCALVAREAPEGLLIVEASRSALELLARAQAPALPARLGELRTALPRQAEDRGIWLPWNDDWRILWLQPESSQDDGALRATADDREAMAYAVSHDLRAPIRVVEGFTRIVREDYGHLLDRVGNDHLERILGAAARMNSMIDALLALSQLSTQPFRRQPVVLSDIARQVLDELRLPSPTRAVETRIAPDVRVQGDPTLLHCLMENLLVNAWKYSARRELARIEFGVMERDGVPVYFVRDNGAGFDMRYAERLFGAFQRLHSASEFSGTGVGLASVQRIVRRHGGQVWAEAAVNAGATFYFTLGAG